MGSIDQVDDRTFRVNFTGEGAEKLRDRVNDKLKEFMGDYTDDTLVVRTLSLALRRFHVCTITFLSYLFCVFLSSFCFFRSMCCCVIDFQTVSTVSINPSSYLVSDCPLCVDI